MVIEKGKTSNGYAKTMIYFKNNVIALEGLTLFFYTVFNLTFLSDLSDELYQY